MLGADREAMNREREVISGSAAACFRTPEERATASAQNQEMVSHKPGSKLITAWSLSVMFGWRRRHRFDGCNKTAPTRGLLSHECFISQFWRLGSLSDQGASLVGGAPLPPSEPAPGCVLTLFVELIERIAVRAAFIATGL